MKSKKRMALALAVCMIAISLSACSGKGTPDGSGKSDSPVQVSETFAQKGIWFQGGSKNEPLAKDSVVSRIFIFDGNGNVVTYETSINGIYDDSKNLYFGDLRDLSDEEIIEFAKERDKAYIETEIQGRIEASKNSDNASGGADPESRAAYEAQVTNLEQLKYKEPEAQPVKLKVKTDETGNQTATETLTFTKTKFIIGCYLDSYMTMERVEAQPTRFEKEKEVVELYPSTGSFTVYDMQFMGLGDLYQRVKEGHPGFVLDSPDTKGIKVD